MADTARIEGLKELKRALDQLPKQLHRRILNAALVAGGRTIVNEAKSRAPVLQEPDPRRKPGTIRANIRARPVKPEDGHDATAIVQVRNLSAKRIRAFKAATGSNAANNPDDPFYWRFVEFGTSKMAAKPFLRPAFEEKKVQAAQDIKQRIAKRIEVEAAKLRAGGRIAKFFGS